MRIKDSVTFFFFGNNISKSADSVFNYTDILCEQKRFKEFFNGFVKLFHRISRNSI